MIRFIRFPCQFDAGRLRQETEQLQQAWLQHFNIQHYEGDWSGIPLRSPGGASTLLPELLGTEQPFEDTPYLLQSPCLREVIATFHCEKTSIRLLKLSRGAIIKEHRDQGLNYEEGEVRLHIPVITHPLVEFYLDGERLPMKAGSCWYINASLPHRLANPSPEDRIHLVIDCMVNDWLKDLFERSDLPVKNVKDTSEEDRQARRQIIEQLRLSGQPQQLRLAEALEKELKNQA